MKPFSEKAPDRTTIRHNYFPKAGLYPGAIAKIKPNDFASPSASTLGFQTRMRLHGMVGDKISIYTDGQAWRPPNYITLPTSTNVIEDRKSVSSDEQSQAKDHPKRKKTRSSGKRTKSPRKKVSAEKKSELRMEEATHSHRYSKRTTLLPLPTTVKQPKDKRSNMLLSRRILALSAATLVALTVLVGLVVQLRKELWKAPSHTDAEGLLFRQSYRFNQRSFKMKNSQSLPERDLQNRNRRVNPTKSVDVQTHSKNQGSFAKFMKYLYAAHFLLESISPNSSKLSPVSASLVFNNMNDPKKDPIEKVLHQRHPAIEKRRQLQSNSLKKRQEHFRNLASQSFHNPRRTHPGNTQIEYNELRISRQSSLLEEKQHKQSRLQFKNDGLQISAKNSQSTVPQSTGVLHSNALSVVGNVRTSVGSFEKGVKTPKPASTPQAEHGNITSSASVHKTRGIAPSLPRNGIPETIEIWSLSQGKFLCRLYNVARLSNGRLVLPKWMQAHSDFLRARCGIEGAVFAIERFSSKGTAEFDKNILITAIEGPFEVDEANSQRDLCGTSAPRNHMPHFITDIFLPLVASETLLGSGRITLPYSAIHRNEALNVQTTSAPQFSEFNPSMLVFDETWKQASSEWVPRVMQFFLNPSIGFSMIRGGPEKIQRSAFRKSPLLATVFRSVISSNVEKHSPFGLFDARGQNIVFDANNISRSPVWTMSGIAKTPCQIKITVLTRKGPRALLKLGKLKERIKALGSKAGIRSAFEVVDFEEKSFNDQVRIMQETNVLIATHGAGNANFIFLRPSAAVIEIFPFAYKAGPFDSFARIFGLEYTFAMSAPQTGVFKECMRRHEHNERISKLALSRWDKAVEEENKLPWIHKLEFEKEFGEPGKSEGMTTRMCVRLQELEFSIDAVSRNAIQSAVAQCSMGRHSGIE